jgi:uncharacterized membrane protein
MSPLEEATRLAIGYLVPLIEAFGALVVTLGAIRAIVSYVRSFLENDPLQTASLRLQLGQSMVMGLEFQVAADILKTALSPTLNEVTLLAALIAVRTALNYFLERELTALAAACETPDSGPSQADVES